MAEVCPLARRDEVIAREVGDELVVYDERREVACSLNATAAIVWREADGERTVTDLAARLREQLGDIADEELVLVTLDRLADEGLLDEECIARSAEEARMARRRFIRKAGVVGAGALALPVVASIVAPVPKAAASTCTSCSGGSKVAAVQSRQGREVGQIARARGVA